MWYFFAGYHERNLQISNLVLENIDGASITLKELKCLVHVRGNFLSVYSLPSKSQMHSVNICSLLITESKYALCYL